MFNTTQPSPFDAFNKMAQTTPVSPTPMDILKASNLITDEVKELLEEAFSDVSIEIKVGAPKPEMDLGNVCGEFTDIIYITGQQATEYGVNVPLAFEEKHRSNMTKAMPADTSKEVLAHEMEIALTRYPDAVMLPCGDTFIMRCPTQNKLIKPEMYTPAYLVEGVHYHILPYVHPEYALGA